MLCNLCGGVNAKPLILLGWFAGDSAPAMAA